MTKKLMMMAAVVAVAIGAWADTETVCGYSSSNFACAGREYLV